MNKLLAIAWAVVADAVRRKVVWVVLVFAAILAFAIPALPSYGQGVVEAIFREVTIALMYVAALVLGLTLAAVRIPSEIDRRTVFNVLSRDVARWQYVAGTWLGQFAVLGAVLAAFTVVAIATGVFIYGAWMPVLLEAAFAVWLEIGVIIALVTVVACQFGPATSVVVGLVFTYIGHAFVTLLNLPEGQSVPWYIPSLEAFNVIDPVAHGTGITPLYALGMLGAFVAWTVLLLGAAGLLLGRRDL